MKLTKYIFLAFLTFLFGVHVLAQDASLVFKAEAAYQKKDFTESARLFLAAIEAGDTSPATLYQGAKALGLAGRKDEAFAILGRLIENASGPVKQALTDPDLESIRADRRWAGLIARATEKEKRLNRHWNNPAWDLPFAQNLTEDAKVAGLSKFWSEVKFNFANFHLVPELDWDALYLEYLPKVRASKSTREYYLLLAELCARLKDGHTSVFPPRDLADELYGCPAISVRLIEQHVILRMVLDPALIAEGVTPGLEILAIDNIPVREYAEKFVGPYLCASTAQDRENRLFGETLLNGQVGKSVELTLRDAGGRVFQKTLPRLTSRTRQSLAPKMPATELSSLPGNIGYIALNQFETESVVNEFEAAFDEIAKTDGLIIDLRNNRGGSSENGFLILNHLTERKTIPGAAWGTRLYRPAYRAWGTLEEWDQHAGPWKAPASKKYSKPVIVLIGPQTYSAAEDFAVAFDVLKRGRILGEPTGGSSGQPLFFSLPGGGVARVCTQRNRYPDGREFVGFGVKPDILVSQTLADFRAGRDTALEAACDELRKSAKSPPPQTKPGP